MSQERGIWVLEGSRERMLAAIHANRTQTAVRIKTKPSRSLFLHLLEQTQVRRIVMSAGLAKTVPARVRAALEGAGARLETISARAGRPARYGEEKKRRALESMGARKRTAAQIARELGVPTSAIYWWKREAGLGRKRRKKKPRP